MLHMAKAENGKFGTFQSNKYCNTNKPSTGNMLVIIRDNTYCQFLESFNNKQPNNPEICVQF